MAKEKRHCPAAEAAEQPSAAADELGHVHRLSCHLFWPDCHVRARFSYSPLRTRTSAGPSRRRGDQHRHDGPERRRRDDHVVHGVPEARRDRQPQDEPLHCFSFSSLVGNGCPKLPGFAAARQQLHVLMRTCTGRSPTNCLTTPRTARRSRSRKRRPSRSLRTALPAFVGKLDGTYSSRRNTSISWYFFMAPFLLLT